MRSGNVEHTSEDQGTIQQPDVAKDPGLLFGMKKYSGWPIEENIDGVIMFKCSNCVLKRVAPKHGRVHALICRATQIEVRVLIQGNTRRVLVTAEVPKNLCKQHIITEFL